MSKKCECSFLGVGDFWYREKGATSKYIMFGNVNEATFSADENRIELPDFTSPGGGNCNVVSRLATPQLTMTISNLCPDTLAIGVRGNITTQAAGAIADEEHVGVYKDSLVQTAYLPDPDQALTVTGFDEGDDFIRTRTGIIITAGSAIADAATIDISYTALGTTLLEALTTSAKEYEILLDGVNEAQSNAPFSVKFHKCKFAPISSLPFIATDDFATIELVAEVLTDDSIVGAGLSKYFTMSRKTAS